VIIEIAWFDILLHMRIMSRQVLRQANKFEQRNAIGGEIHEDSPIAILRAALLQDGRYGRYLDVPGKIKWPEFCADLEEGRTWFDDLLFPLTYAVCKLPPGLDTDAMSTDMFPLSPSMSDGNQNTAYGSMFDFAEDEDSGDEMGNCGF
jgi:hypothetical protein